MNTLLILAPLVGVGIGLASAYQVTRGQKRIHFVEEKNLQSEIDDLDIEVAGSETCGECGDEIEPSEIGAVVRDGEEYVIICDDSKCLDTYDLR